MQCFCISGLCCFACWIPFLNGGTAAPAYNSALELLHELSAFAMLRNDNCSINLVDWWFSAPSFWPWLCISSDVVGPTYLVTCYIFLPWFSHEVFKFMSICLVYLTFMWKQFFWCGKYYVLQKKESNKCQIDLIKNEVLPLNCCRCRRFDGFAVRVLAVIHSQLHKGVHLANQ